jgi:hypothetical protein
MREHDHQYLKRNYWIPNYWHQHETRVIYIMNKNTHSLIYRIQLAKRSHLKQLNLF